MGGIERVKIMSMEKESTKVKNKVLFEMRYIRKV